MRTVTLPLTTDGAPYVAAALHPDGTATLYEPGDALPHSLQPQHPTLAPISARQIRLALTRAGLRQAVEQAVAGAGGDLRDWWEYSIEYHREHELVGAMAVAIDATPEQVDAVWRLGFDM